MMNKKIPDFDAFKAFGKLMESHGLDDKPKAPIRTRLRDLASQEGCDGEPYDTMQEAAEYIERIELELGELYGAVLERNPPKGRLFNALRMAQNTIRDI